MISTEVTKDLFKARKFLFYGILPVPIIRHILATTVTMWLLNYMGVIFNALTFEHGMKFMAANYYCVPILLFGSLAFTRGSNLVKRA